MLKYSANFLENFRVMRENSILKSRMMVVLDINESQYRELYLEYNKYNNIARKLDVPPEVIIEDYNSGQDMFKIYSRSKFFTNIGAIYKFLNNSFVNYRLNENVDERNKKLFELVDIKIQPGSMTYETFGIEYGYTIDAIKCIKGWIRRRVNKKEDPTKPKRKSPVKGTKYKSIDVRDCNFTDDPEACATLARAFIGLESGKSKRHIGTVENLSPRLMNRLESDMILYKKSPFLKKAVALIKEGMCTIREIEEQTKTYKILNSISRNTYALIRLGIHPKEILMKENRRAVGEYYYKGDRTYLDRIRRQRSIYQTERFLRGNDAEYDNDVNIIKHVASNSIKSAMNKFGKTEKEIKHIIDKYYIYE